MNGTYAQLLHPSQAAQAWQAAQESAEAALAGGIALQHRLLPLKLVPQLQQAGGCLAPASAN